VLSMRAAIDDRNATGSPNGRARHTI
jgi:hypothetical protein